MAPTHPYGVGSAKRHSAEAEIVCSNERPTWWLPDKYHCALDKELQRYPGITCHDFWRLFHRQGGLCAVCGEPPGSWRFTCDRNHDTNEIDGLVHHRCNRPITQQVRRYLANPPGRELGLRATPAAVERMERRRVQQRKMRAKSPKKTTPDDDYADKVAAALKSSAAHTNGGKRSG